ncbi:uncharacterized protein LOC111892557 isoform X1 [Lactuca sativa]|uniref:uncharacterized protein LOC111892557 isoform X1 n=2 Tax=Lactuca sativa TaxID=4236 RepID=UPI000CC24CDA|nr:uncharacterized protein LOC111892557 isoform X1 [Lactuca sativa]
MSNLLELTGLFSRLASQIETGNGDTDNADQSDDVLVAALNQSLNLSEQSRVRVLDTALSLMCFTSPQVFDSVIEYSVNTIVSVLSSLIECEVLKSDKSEVLRIGGYISAHDCVRVMESCVDVLGKLTEHGMLSRSLLYAVVRVAVMRTQFQYTMQLTPVFNVQSTEEMSHALSKLVYYIPKTIPTNNQELQLRLLIWYLDPQTLLEDISQLLQEAIGRPFICLNDEFYEKLKWRSVIIFLALSPLFFIETRSLLHTWFLHTGLDSVLELQVGLVSMLLDLLSRPIYWGLSAEIGSKLPFSNAYFLSNHNLLRTFNEPLSYDGFLELVHKIKDSTPQTNTISMVDHKSTWSIAMNFPDWFYFASFLLSGRSFDYLQQTSSCSAAASWYISWILDPVTESVSGILAEKLSKLSKPLVINLSTIRIWLKEFQDVKAIDIQKNAMFRRITFGILIGSYSSITEDGFELLLHYVTTGIILRSTESQHTRLKEAVACACSVFNLTDIAERISDSVCDAREIAVEIICQIKLRVVKYLIKCVNSLLQFQIDQNNLLLYKDLHRRMLRWRNQGKDVFHGYKDLDDAINTISSKLLHS